MLAGYDPATIEFRLVLDVAWALVIEIYREYGMKFQEAMDEITQKVTDPADPVQRPARAPDNASSMAMLQAMIKDSDFGGPKA